MSTERFLFMVSGKNVPSTRFRMLPYVSALRALGYRCDVAYSYPEKYDSYKMIGWRLSQRLQRSVRNWQAIRARFKNYSAIVIERELFDTPDAQVELKLSQLSAKIILDIDDGIFLRYPEKFKQLFQVCDHVIAGSSIIADAIRADANSVTVIPTVLNLEDYHLDGIRAKPSSLRVGWIGTDSNVEYLNIAIPAIRNLQREESFPLRVITGSSESMMKLNSKGVNVEFVQWQPDTAIQRLAECDIGIMPLPDDDWQRYKCGCKLLQCMACGIPSVASPVGVNEDIIKHDDNGFLAKSTEEWEQSLGKLVVQPELRQIFGQNGRATVENQYSLQSQIPRFLQVLLSTGE